MTPKKTATSDPATETPRERLRPRGSNQVGMRQFNERVVLQSLRLHGSLPKADLARLTHLSAQTIALIMQRLLDDELVLKGAPVRGKVGQPSVPISLNPDGAYSIGIKIGRRSLDVLLIDFLGQVRKRETLAYDFPDPDTLFPEIETRLHGLLAGLGRRAARLQGVGIAAPLSLGGWQSLLGVDAQQSEKWAQVDIRARVAEMVEVPVEFVKDTAAACVAELLAGRGRELKTFLYIFVDTFIGGGLVIDSQLYVGRSGNAGALGSYPLGLVSGGAPAQLLGVASLLNLERRYLAAGLDAAAVGDARALHAPWLPHTEDWLREAAHAIALAINGATALLDLEHVILDGNVAPGLRDALIAAVLAACGRYSWEGLSQPQLFAGLIGADARALGGALLPLYAHFAPDHALFLKLEG